MSDISREQSHAKNSEEIEKVTAEIEAGSDASEHQVTSFQWRAPLPPPRVLKEYSESVQEKIVDEMILEADHRRQIENQDADSNIRIRDAKIKSAGKKDKMAGRLIQHQFIETCFVFVVVLAVIGAAVYLIDSGKQPGWLIVLLAVLSGVVPLLRRVIGVSRKSDEEEAK